MLGFATSFVLAALREIRFHRRINALKKDNQAKDREITDLRTLPLKADTPAAQEPLAKEQTGE